MAPSRPWVIGIVATLAVAAAVAVAVRERLADPLSTPVIPAEDPYTHMALVREHVRDGSLDALYEPGGMYPPGLHALLAAVWVYTGIDLYEIVRLGPVVFGAIAVLGVGILAAGFHGPKSEAALAAVVAAVALAIAPEVIFRTTMMSPTALDLAVLPFFLYATLAVLLGRLRWLGVAAPLSAFLIFSHPWLFGVLGLAGALFAGLALVMPWNEERAPSISTLGLAAVVLLIGSSLALGLRGCAVCGTGFGFVAGESEVAGLADAWMPVLVASLLVSGALAFTSRRLPVLRGFHWQPRSKGWLAVLAPIWPAILLGYILVLALPAVERGMPPYVNLPAMLGWPLLILAAAGWTLLPFARSPAAHLGGAIAAATFPFVIYNPLDSPFWSHRTVVYFAVGAVLLAGVAVALAARAVAAAVLWVSRNFRNADFLARPAAVAVPAILVGLTLTGGVVAATPDAYEGGWYRLFSECDFEALEHVAANATANPDAIVITGDWQSKLVLAALTDDASRIWFSSTFFTDQGERDGIIRWLSDEDRPLIVVVDQYFPKSVDRSYLQSAPWVPMSVNACTEDARAKVYQGEWEA